MSLDFQKLSSESNSKDPYDYESSKEDLVSKRIKDEGKIVRKIVSGCGKNPFKFLASFVFGSFL